jgi:hypothetical protein
VSTSSRYRLLFPDGTTHIKSLPGPTKKVGDLVAVGDSHWIVVSKSKDDEKFDYELVLRGAE